jgi:DNA-binding beta-propeller fold protein YncE
MTMGLHSVVQARPGPGNRFAFMVLPTHSMKMPSIRRFAWVGSFAVAAFLPGPAHAAESLPLLVPGVTIKIADAKGSFDFLELDLAKKRLVACHTKGGTVDVIDLATNKVLARIPTGASQDVAIDAKTGKYFATISDRKQVAIIDSVSLKVTNTVPTEGELDAILLDPKNRRVYATHDHGKSVWVIDADTEKLVATVAIPGDPEVLAYDPVKDRVYLNIIPTHETVVIDPKTEAVVDHWSDQPAQRPHGLVLDADTGRLFSAGANGQMVVIDTNTGKVLAAVKIADRVDQVAFDPGLRRVYCASDGVLSVVQETPDGAVLLGDVQTAKGGKNVAVDPQTHAVWTMSTDGTHSYAKSWVLP